jgi:hypothetical protein
VVRSQALDKPLQVVKKDIIAAARLKGFQWKKGDTCFSVKEVPAEAPEGTSLEAHLAAQTNGRAAPPPVMKAVATPALRAAS